MDVDLAWRAVNLRLIAPTDRALYHALHSSPEVMRTVGPVLAPAEIDARFERVQKHNLLDTPGHRAWLIAVGGEPLGLTALTRDGSRAEFGIMLLPLAWHRDLLPSALAALLPHAFGAMRLERIDASSASKRVTALDRVLFPFGFERTVGLRPGEVGWTLTARQWSACARG